MFRICSVSSLCFSVSFSPPSFLSLSLPPFSFSTPFLFLIFFLLRLTILIISPFFLFCPFSLPSLFSSVPSSSSFYLPFPPPPSCPSSSSTFPDFLPLLLLLLLHLPLLLFLIFLCSSSPSKGVVNVAQIVLQEASVLKKAQWSDVPKINWPHCELSLISWLCC